MTHTKTRSKYLRALLTLPKLTGVDIFKTSKHRLEYEHLLGTIWRELIKRLEHPIEITISATSRRVEVLGIVRYYINLRTNQVTCRIKQSQFLEGVSRVQFKPTSHVMVDPPLVCNKNLLEVFVNLWINEINYLALSSLDCKSSLSTDNQLSAETILAQLTHSIYKAICVSTYWNHLRQDIFKAAELDADIIKMTRLSRDSLKIHNLSERHFNHVCKHREAYRQIYKDAPNLLWLYKIALDEKIIYHFTENPVLDLKKAILDSDCSPRTWRIITNSNQRDFDAVIKSNGNNWYYLIEYLQLHERLNRNKALPKALAHFFDNPVWELPWQNQNILYRGATFPPALFNKFIDEALLRQTIAHSQCFFEREMAPVLTWLTLAKPKFDSNQLSKPWSWFIKKTIEWNTEQIIYGRLKSLSWSSGIPESDFAGYRFTPLTSAWQVRLEALRQRHCVDHYIKQCIEGKYKIFHIQQLDSKAKYTLGLKLERKWKVDQIAGFANRPSSSKLRWICQSIADSLSIV